MTRDDLLAQWTEYATRVEARLIAGQAAYGDSAETRPLCELEREIAEELEDVCGWAFLLWRRLQAIQQRHHSIERACACARPRED